EKALLEMILREQIENGTATVSHFRTHRLESHCEQRARRSLCHCLTLATRDQALEPDGAPVTHLLLTGPYPDLRFADGQLHTGHSEDRSASGAATLEPLLGRWL